MVEVVITDEFEGWYEDLDDAASEAVYTKVGLLQQHGVALGFPHSSAIKGSRYSLRELRIKAHGQQLRVLYCFDMQRQAVLLLGGDKTGDDRFYAHAIPQAERLWEVYLTETAGEDTS